MQTRITWTWILRLETFFQVRLNGHWYIAKMKVRSKWECTHNQSQGRVFIPRNYLLVGVVWFEGKKGKFSYDIFSSVWLPRIFWWRKYEILTCWAPLSSFLSFLFHMTFCDLFPFHTHATNLLVFYTIILLFPVRKCKFAKSFLSKSTSYIFKYVREEEPLTPRLKW